MLCVRALNGEQSSLRIAPALVDSVFLEDASMLHQIVPLSRPSVLPEDSNPSWPPIAKEHVDSAPAQQVPVRLA